MNDMDNKQPITIPIQDQDTTWSGLTLEQLRMRRAKALVRREVGKVKVNSLLDGMRTRVNDNGIRGLMFKDNTLMKLKTADYVFLGWQLARAFIKLRRKR